jgi:hypothetical protein
VNDEEIFVRYRFSPDDDWHVLGHADHPGTWMDLREIFLDHGQGHLEMETVALSQAEIDAMPEVEECFEPGLLGIPLEMARALGGQQAVLVAAVSEEVLSGEADETSISYAVTPIFCDPRSWGIALHDLVQHLSNAYVHKGFSPVQTRAAILETFEAERDSPTDSPGFETLN